MNRDHPPESVLQTFNRLLTALDPVLELTQRAGNDELLVWSGLAALDAIDLGEQLGMLYDMEAGAAAGGDPCRDRAPRSTATLIG